MTAGRAFFLLLGALSIAGASWLGYHGVGGESPDLNRSVRVGSGGNGFANANVK